MGCATGTVRYLVFLFNLCISLVGLALLIVGTIKYIDSNALTKEIDEKYLTHAPLVMLILGAIIFTIAFLGCCGAIKESSCMLLMYAIILLVLFILQVSIGVYAFLNVKDKDFDDLKDSLRRDLKNQIDKAPTNNASMVFLDEVQKTLECCGADGPNDWSQSRQQIPLSCCKELEVGKVCKKSDAYNDGCAVKVAEALRDGGRVIGYVAIGLCVVELVAAIFALCLNSSITNERRRHGYA